MSNFGFVPGDFFNAAGGKKSQELITLDALRESSRSFLAPHEVIPVGAQDQAQMNEALEIAEHWLDTATTFPATSSKTDCAWSRREWLDNSLAGWQKIVEPLAEGMASALGTVLTEMTQDLGGSTPEGMDSETSNEVRDAIAENLGLPQGFPMGGFTVDAINPLMRAFMGSLVATQLGLSVGGLALKVTGSHDVSLPLFAKPGAHLIPQNVKEWAKDLDIEEREVAYFLALREAAAARLFAHTPWLSQYIQECMTQYGKGIRIDIESIQQQAEEAMASGELDINNPASINIAINQGMFMPEQTAQQAAALEKLEMALALIEGWVDNVVVSAAQDRLPSIISLQEMQRRSRATNSPSQQLFASLLGLEVSPRKARECAHFWSELVALGNLQDETGLEVRDHRWEDSALLPTLKDLADPAAFIRSTTVPDDLSGLL
jgi:putative hydrolase